MIASPWSKALLTPKSVVLVGASDDAAKTSGRPLRYLRGAGFAGTVYVVNPARETVQGERAYASLDDLPEIPDHAFILTGAERALESLEACERVGIPVATILSAGFAEAGEAGEANERRLREIVARGKVRVVGPSSIGVVNLHNGLVLTANAAFAEERLPRGGIFVGSHSGSLIGALVSRGKRKGIGLAGLVSMGGEADLSMGDICSATLDDETITGYLLFLETMRHADRLRDFALEAYKRGKPVAAYKLGRSNAAAELAVSHTGSLAGADDVADAFLRQCGIARVETFEGLLEIMPLLQRLDATGGKRAGRVGVVTTTGGGAAMAVDQLALRGVDVVPPSSATRARLAETGIDGGSGRIVDLTLAGTRYDVMKSTLDIMRSAPEFDLVLATVGSSARFNPELAVQPVIDAGTGSGHPVCAFIVPEAAAAVQLLTASGTPTFEDPETCADAIAAAFRRQKPSAPAAALPAAPAARSRHLTEAEAYALLSRFGIASAPTAVLSPDQPVPDLPFDYPVVAKVLDAEIAHKSDAGGVVLDIVDAGQLTEAMRTIAANVEAYRPSTTVRQILVQPMTRGVGEVLLGFRRDPDIGPVVVLAAGGIFTELYRDTVIRLAPASLETAREMIDELASSKMLDGYRGRPRGDLEALAQAIVAISRLAVAADPFVEEAEVNPLLVRPVGKGVVALDGLIRVRRT